MSARLPISADIETVPISRGRSVSLAAVAVVGVDATFAFERRIKVPPLHIGLEQRSEQTRIASKKAALPSYRDDGYPGISSKAR